MAKYSLENLRRVSRRETATNLELLVDDDDGAKTPLQINTIPQLKAWMAKDPREVLLAIQTFRQHDQAATAEFNEVNDKIDELRTAYDEQVITIIEADGRIEFLEGQLRDARQSTPSTVSMHHQRSIKIPDPPMFTDGKEIDWDTWVAAMRSKLTANDDHFSTESLRIAYVQSRITKPASAYIAPRLRPDSLKPFLAASEIFNTLANIYGDPDREHTARAEFNRLTQGNKEFSAFWAEFQRLMVEIDATENRLIWEFRRKLSFELQQGVARERPTNIFDFARLCQHLDQNLREANKQRASRDHFATRTAVAPVTARTTQEKTTTTTTTPILRPSYLNRTNRPYRAVHPDAAKEKLMQEGKCFRCQKPGHMSGDCPDKGGIMHEMDTDGRVSIRDSEKE